MVRTRSTKPVSASTRSASTAVVLTDTKVGSAVTTDSDKNGIQNATTKTATPTKSSLIFPDNGHIVTSNQMLASEWGSVVSIWPIDT